MLIQHERFRPRSVCTAFFFLSFLKDGWKRPKKINKENYIYMHNSKYQCNYGCKLHIPPTNYHLLAAAQQKPHTKALLLRKNEFSGKRSQRMDHQQKNDKTKRAKEIRQKKRGDGKEESKDSPELPDMGINIRHSRPLFGGQRFVHTRHSLHAYCTKFCTNTSFPSRLIYKELFQEQHRKSF